MFSYDDSQGGWYRLMQFLDCFLELRHKENLFPKQCRSCGEEFQSLSEYLCLTHAKGHVFEDCSRIMKRPYTMVYRHCTCGNTLVLVLTEDVFPSLEEFWLVIRDLSEEIGIPSTSLLEEFASRLEQHVIKKNPCLRASR